MSHVVLARKYRPRSFDQMVGQEHVVQALGNALASGRLHHAYLFTGTRGIGKTTVSRILAKSLNCTGPDGQGGVTAQPCGQCQACTEIDADRYIDYIELDAASNRSIDEIRDLIERAAYKPSVGRFKVFMIDEAHQLTKDSFNALLKTLEEPPEYLKFVLATTDPEKMLPTVLSRCLQFNLRPMAPEVVHAHLKAVLEAEQVAADAGSLRLLSRAARGSMRDALSLTDQAIAYGAGGLTEEGVRTMLGSVDRRHAARLVQALAQRDGPALLQAIDELRGWGLSASGTLEEMAALLQQMAVQQAVPGALDENDAEAADAVRLAGLMPPDETQLLYSIAIHGRAYRRLGPYDPPARPRGGRGVCAARAAGGAATAAPAPRSAPLQAAPREARMSTAALPAPLPKPLPVPAAARVAPAPVPAAAVPAAAAMPVAEARPPAVAAPMRAPAAAASEPPPWVDEAVPDDAVPDAPTPMANPLARAAVAASASAELRPTPEGERWAALVRPLLGQSGLTALVRELAVQAQLLGVDGQTWRLRVERETLRSNALRDKLLAALEPVLGAGARIELEAGAVEDSIARREAAEREAAQRAAEDVIHNDPAVGALMAQFRTARIVPGSIKPL